MESWLAEARRIGEELAEDCLRESRDAAGPEDVAAAELRGVLVAEGDSWFDYPGGDILSLLVDRYQWDVRSVAHRGDNLESMAYDKTQVETRQRVFTLLARRGEQPAAVLLSGGGNDLAGPELVMALEHVKSELPLVNEEVLKQLLLRLRKALVALVSAIEVQSTALFGSSLPVVMHGYGFPVPDGRGFLGGWGPLPGPWLEPSFARKGVPEADLDARRDAMRHIVERFNEMLRETAGEEGMEHLHVVDVTDKLKSDASYREWWANELHPTPQGFRAVTTEIAQAIDDAVP
jgi:lysophospholipase L1-like esterase